MGLYASLNGARVVSGSITIPLYGTWSGDLGLALTDTITSPASLVLSNLTLLGTVYRTSSFAGSRTCRLVGGYGGWMKALPFKQYINASGIMASVLLEDVAAECGEQINVLSDFNVGNQWVRLGPSDEDPAPAQRTLRQVGGPLWWMAPSGVTQVGPRPTKAITSSFTVVEWSGARGQFTIATEDLASWMPGNTFTAPTVPTVQTISSVTISTDNKGVLRLNVLVSAPELNP